MKKASSRKKTNKKRMSCSRKIREFFSGEKNIVKCKRTIALEAVVCVLENSKKNLVNGQL